VQGLNAVPPADRPPVNVVRVAFQTMVGIGTLLAALGVLTLLVRVRRGRLPAQRAFFAAVAAAGPLSCVALVAGWVTTEVGRQPWVVHGVMRTRDAVTGADIVPVSYAGLWVLYLVVGAGTVWILRRLARVPVELPPGQEVAA
jgi:cytochrome d ubiquinol oxidase subunit I